VKKNCRSESSSSSRLEKNKRPLSIRENSHHDKSNERREIIARYLEEATDEDLMKEFTRRKVELFRLSGSYQRVAIGDGEVED